MNETLNYESLLRLLTENKVKMIVIGAVAMNLRATDNVTYDLDICFERSTENIERLCRALAPHCPAIRSAFIDMMDFLKTNPVGEKFSTDFGDIDLLGEVPGLGDYQATLQFASIVQLEDFSVQALTLDGLIKAKEAANRPKDQLHLITLRALKKMEDEE
ncbi:MAG: hypothetical protein HY740_09440 [Chloroflexi bacterium]|nr:hypothetical protein [Chloroflexota bacterium]MBI5053959.1 hypothetical protein [Chloroflexota bacterium]